MQVVPAFNGKSAFQTAGIITKQEGLFGFYRGCVGPLFGTSFSRAIQFTSYETFYTIFQKDKYLTIKIPYTMGLEPRIILGGIVSGTTRALVECPFEFTKVKGQTGQSWYLNEVYSGFKATWLKAVGLMTSYFILVDTFKRNTNAYNTKYGLFFMNGFCAVIAFIVIWPIEIVKNKVQMLSSKKYSIKLLIRENIQEKGIYNAMLRGSLPGLSSVFIRNGFAMITMLKTQGLLTRCGFRD